MEHSEHFDWTGNSAKNDLLVCLEYEAGYQARVEGSEDYRTATPSWRSGRSDADHDLQSGVLTNGWRQFENTDSNWSRFGPGWYARSCELPFDSDTEFSWKREWVLADIALRISARKGGA